MKKIIYNTNDIVGNCVYLNELPKEKGHRYALFRCSLCNNPFKARISHVKAKAINTCECTNPKHRHKKSNTRLYHIWEAMLQRCNNKNHPKYKIYGARNITVDPEWNLFTSFEHWALTNGYTETLTLDRIDTNANYTPANCRWATKSTQQANRRKSLTTKHAYIGIEKQRNGRFSARICHNNKRITIGVYDTEYEAAMARDYYILNNKLPHTLSILTRPLNPCAS